MSRLLRLALAAVLLAPVSATAAPRPPARPRPPALAGTVRITTSKSVAMVVRLPKPVYFENAFVALPGTTVTGDGRIVGVALLDPERDRAYEAIRFGFCGTPGCAPYGPRLFFAVNSGNPASRSTLPAGEYRLLVITDGRPITATLTFPGLPGKVTLKPTKPLQVAHVVPEFKRLPTAVGTTYTGAAPYGVDGERALLLHQFAAITDISASHEMAFCMYTGATVEYEPAPYCPGGSGDNFSRTQLRQEPSQARLYGSVRYMHEGYHRAGTFFNTIGIAHDPFSTMTWVTLPNI